MIDVRNVTVSHGERDVLAAVSFAVNKGDRLGFVGPNGAGKTTIFSLLIGEISTDGGDVSIQRGLKMGYLRQQLMLNESKDTLLDYTENALPAIRNIEHQIETIEADFQAKSPEEREKSLRLLGQLQTDFENQGGYELSMRAKTALGGFGFTQEDMHKPIAAFSGGWQMRVELARALVARPDLLLLDEPTNFLDIPAVEWLQKFLRDYTGTLLLISHDRYLLNTLTTATYEVVGGNVTRYPGNYDYYERERVKRYEQMLGAKKNQDRKREQMERFVERFRAKNTKAALVQSWVRKIEKLEEIEIPVVALPQARIRVAKPPHCGVEIMRLENCGVTYDGTRWVLRGIDLRIQRGEKIALIGLNGMGKTTLLRILAGVLPPNEGKRVVGHKVVPGYQAQDFAEMMDPSWTVYETLKAANPDATEQSLRNLLGSFLFSGDDIEKTIGILSGGEKMRIAFARLLLNPPNFLLLDEPTTHLDIASREMLERALQDYEGTLCLVSHDIEFVRRVANQTIAMTPPGVTRYAGGYDYYHECVDRQQGLVSLQEERDNYDPQRGASKKDARRERAQKRQELRKTQIPLEKEIKFAETRIAELEKEQKELLAMLEGSAAVKDYSIINKRLSRIKIETDDLTARWERAGLALEKTKVEEEG